jgi:hypothetical protein
MFSHVFVPSLDAQYADLGLAPQSYAVTATSETPGGAVCVQVFTGAGYLWLTPTEYLPACAAPACVFAAGHDGPHDVIVGRWAA